MSLLAGVISRASGRASPCWRRAPGVVATRALSSMDSKAKPNMALIKELREASGAPVVDCKDALAVSHKVHRERKCEIERCFAVAVVVVNYECFWVAGTSGGSSVSWRGVGMHRGRQREKSPLS